MLKDRSWTVLGLPNTSLASADKLTEPLNSVVEGQFRCPSAAIARRSHNESPNLHGSEIRIHRQRETSDAGHHRRRHRRAAQGVVILLIAISVKRNGICRHG